jgi:hypothetical protein
VIDRHREGEALASLRRNGQGVHADHRPRPIDERSAAVAWIDRRVSLDERDVAELTDGADDASGSPYSRAHPALTRRR